MAVTTVVSCVTEGRESAISCLATLKDHVFVGRRCGVIDVMDICTHERLQRLYPDSEEYLAGLGLTNNDRLLVSLSANGVVSIWDLASYQLIDSTHLVGIERAYDMVVVCESVYVACGNNSVVQVSVEMDDRGKVCLVNRGVVFKDTSAITCIASISDEEVMLAGTADSRVIIFNASTKSPGYVIALPRRAEGIVKRRKIEGGFEAFPSEIEPGVNVFKLAEEMEKKRRAAEKEAAEQLIDAENVVMTIGRLDAHTGIVGDSSGRVFIIDGVTGTVIQEHQQHTGAPVVSIATQTDKTFYTASLSGKVTRYVLSKDSQTYVPLCDRQAKVSESSAVAVDSKERIIVGGSDGYLRVYKSPFEFVLFSSNGSVTPLSLNSQCAVVGGEKQKLLLEGRGSRTLTVWSIIRTKKSELSKLHARIVSEARGKLKHPLCRSMEKANDLADIDPWEVVKVAEIEFVKTIENTCVCYSKDDVFRLLVSCCRSKRYYFELDLKNLSLKKINFNKKPAIAAGLEPAQISGMWSLMHKEQVKKALVAFSRASVDGNGTTVVSSNLALVDYQADKLKTVYSAVHAPISRVQILGSRVLIQSVDGKRPYKLFELEGDALRHVADIVPKMPCSVMILGDEYVLELHDRQSFFAAFDIGRRKWVTAAEKKYVLPAAFRPGLLLSGGRWVGERKFIAYGAQALIGVELKADGSEVVNVDAADAALDEHSHIQDITPVGKELLLFANQQNNVEMFKPRVYGRL